MRRVQMHDRVILRPRGIHREMQPGLLRRHRAVDMPAVHVEPADRAGVEPAERDIGRRHQEAAVAGQTHAQVARGATAVSTQKERASEFDERVSRLLFRHRAHSSALTKKFLVPKLPDFRANTKPAGSRLEVQGTPGSSSSPNVSIRMRSACSTAPDVSPPATTNVRTPRSASATAIAPKVFSTRPDAAA